MKHVSQKDVRKKDEIYISCNKNQTANLNDNAKGTLHFQKLTSRSYITRNPSATDGSISSMVLKSPVNSSLMVKLDMMVLSNCKKN